MPGGSLPISGRTTPAPLPNTYQNSEVAGKTATGAPAYAPNNPPMPPGSSEVPPGNPFPGNPAITSAGATGQMSIAGIITQVAQRLAAEWHVDPNRLIQIALAAAQQESGGNPNAVGDQGTSFGIYQLHQGGELGNETQQWADNPWNNASTAIAVMAQVLAQNPKQSDGWIAAHAQRPADMAGYAKSVDSMIAKAPNGLVQLVSTATGPANGAVTAAAVTGGPGGGGAPAQTPASTTIGQLGLATAQQNYPELAWMLTIPDAAADISTWAAGDYTPDEIAARLEGKAWYQRLGASFFTWIGTQATNPTQAAQTYQEQLAAVRQTFAQLGLKPSAQQLQTFAYQALAQDWQNHPELEQQAIAGTIAVNKDGTFSVRNYGIVGGVLQSTFIGPQGNTASTNSADYQTTMPASYVTNGLVSQIGTVGKGTEKITTGAPVYAMVGGQLQQNFDIKKLAPGTPLYTLPNFVTGPTNQPATGAESTMAGSLQNAQQVFETTGAQYLVPISKQGAAQLVQQAIAGGTTDIATFAKTYFEAQAKSLYPTMAAAIDAGITPEAYTQPYRQVVANALGISPDQVNMADPKYMRFVTSKDPKTGVPTAMSLYDAQQLVMSDPVYGYMKGQPAIDRASAIAQGLGEMFGKTPGTPAGFSGVQAPAA